jgi:hypothetical protein
MFARKQKNSAKSQINRCFPTVEEMEARTVPAAHAAAAAAPAATHPATVPAWEDGSHRGMRAIDPGGK